MPAQTPVSRELERKYAAEIARLEALTPAERWAYWKEQFAKCIKCYACRQVCPFCFCEQCLCDRNKPQMVDTTPRPAGNIAWHIVRAMHLAGRCAGCAECERVCPMDIPLNLLNRKMAKELKELYDHEAGFEVQEKGPLNMFTEKDDQIVYQKLKRMFRCKNTSSRTEPEHPAGHSLIAKAPVWSPRA